MIQAEKLSEVLLHDVIHGELKTCEQYNLTAESLARYRREAKTKGLDVDELKIVNELRKKYTSDELQILLKSKPALLVKSVRHDFTGEQIKIGVISDTHIGSKYFRRDWFTSALIEFYKQKCSAIYHCGDVFEGFSTRIPGHFNELTHMGFNDQLEYGIKVFSKVELPIYAIDGNHDRWYMHQNGAIIVRELCHHVPTMHFIGQDEGDIDLNGVSIKLWHGNDGGAYAISYRLQKIVEAFTGGEKPNMVLAGHDHKAISVMLRNIHCIGTGCLSTQSKFLRSKRIPVVPGFYILDMVIGDREIKRLTTTWYPFYS